MTSTPSSEVAGFVAGLVQRLGSDRTSLLQVLREVQYHYGCVDQAASAAVGAAMGISPMHVECVVDFYSFLHRTPRGRYDVLFSDNIIDRMLGKERLMQRLCDRLGVTPGQTRGDGRVSVANTSCTGMSDQGPAILVNGFALTHLTPERVDYIADLIEREVPLRQWPGIYCEVQDNVRRRDLLLGDPFVDGSAIRAAVDHGPEAILAELDRSGLRGLGGAGFKTATKWALCRQAPGHEHVVVCNADEGEPGTFKDRVLLQSHANLVIEGMTVCARVIGARRGYIYLRGEYRFLLEPLQKTLARRREAGLLGQRILGREGFDFDIAIHLGAGAYVCGEESALIESLEGKRGVPRKRPPFPVTRGHGNEPTVVNNVETFVVAAKVALHGGAWWASLGTPKSPGTKLLSVSGDCERPGVYEYPFGVPIRQVLEDCVARDPCAVQVAGPAGHLVPERDFHRRIAYEDLPTGGSFMIFGRGRDLLEVVRNFTGFFMHESCGFCTPCRVGTSLLHNLVEKVAAGHGTAADLQEMKSLGRVMKEASHCGLGATAPNPVVDTLDQFPEIWASRLGSAEFAPAFDLDGALAESRALTGRDDARAHLALTPHPAGDR
jgi:[NiFe] hydrogenase diaphorase moiety large subunit